MCNPLILLFILNLSYCVVSYAVFQFRCTIVLGMTVMTIQRYLIWWHHHSPQQDKHDCETFWEHRDDVNSRSKDMINWHERHCLITIITQRHPDKASTFYFVLFSRVFDLFQNYSSIRHRMHLLVVVTYLMVSWLKKYPSIVTHVYWTNASYKQSFDVFGTAEQVITREMKPEFWLHL